ncbi:MAG: leucine-rich repeat domain-containing protein, partial [Muribaculaceae bacterium]|nr:leucine-rich repeat domain-containing protein [Muribaculaceae bacterium]
CSSLTSVYIPESVTPIDRGAFVGCTSLASIDIPNSVTEILSQAFAECTVLTTVEIPNSVTTIGARAFQYCESLESIKLSNRLEELVEGTFEGCSNLSSISIPGSVNTIFQSGIWMIYNEEDEDYIETEYFLFSGCEKLNTLILEYSPHALISGHHNAGYTPEITDWENWTENIEYATFDRQMEFDMPLPKLKALVLGEHLDKVQVKNISECDKLESIDCLSLMPPAAGEFSEAQYSNVRLRVPDDALDAYKQHKVWGKFLNLSGGIISGESNVAISPAQRKETGRYDLYGHSVSEDYQGMVIIRYSDGTSGKVFVR